MNLLNELGKRKTNALWYAWDSIRLSFSSSSTRTRRVDLALLGVENPDIFED